MSSGANDGPTMSAAPAGSPTGACPYSLGNTGGTPKWDVPQQKKIPCDIKSVTVTLNVPGGKIISVTGNTPSASAVGLPDVDPDTNVLLSEYAAVIQYVAPAVANGAAAPSATNEVNAYSAEPLHGTVFMKEAMRANCGHHAEVVRAPELKKKETDKRRGTLEVKTKDWSALEFVKGLFGGGDLPGFVMAQRKAMAFEAGSCGWPANGDPVGHLSAIVEMVIADDWRLDFSWRQGLAFNFSHSATEGRAYRDGTKTESRATSSQFNDEDGRKETKSSAITRDGKAIYSSTFDSSKEKGKQKEESASLSGNSMERDVEVFKDTDSAALAKLKTLSDTQAKKSFNEGLQIRITRNGVAVLDSDQWGKLIKEIQDIINTFNDFLFRLMLLFEMGAKAGIPVSITLKFELQLVMLKGSIFARTWPEQTPAKQSGAYYITGYQPRFQVGFDLNLFSLTLKPSFTFQAKVVHSWIASATITIEASVIGECNFRQAFSTGSEHYSRKFGAGIRMSVKGTGELAAASCYLKIEATAASGINFTQVMTFDGSSLKFGLREVKSRRVEFFATFRRGNKILDYFGIGSSEPDWQWPEQNEGPFVWIQPGALNRTF